MTIALPDQRGYYRRFGGKYVPETLMPALEEQVEELKQALAGPEVN